MANALSYVHRFVPASDPAQSATLLLLHGTGGNADDLLALGAELLPGAALLSPQGDVLESGMPRFFRRLAEGVFDIPNLKEKTHQLADFIQAAAEEYSFDAQNVIAIGFSNGANIAASLLLLRPEVLAGAVLLRPMVPLVPETLPDLSNVPVLLAAGTHDPIISPDETKRLEALLSKAGAAVTVHYQQGGHGLMQGDIDAAQAFLRGNLP